MGGCRAAGESSVPAAQDSSNRVRNDQLQEQDEAEQAREGLARRGEARIAVLTCQCAVVFACASCAVACADDGPPTRARSGQPRLMAPKHGMALNAGVRKKGRRSHRRHVFTERGRMRLVGSHIRRSLEALPWSRVFGIERAVLVEVLQGPRRPPLRSTGGSSGNSLPDTPGADANCSRARRITRSTHARFRSHGTAVLHGTAVGAEGDRSAAAQRSRPSRCDSAVRSNGTRPHLDLFYDSCGQPVKIGIQSLKGLTVLKGKGPRGLGEYPLRLLTNRRVARARRRGVHHEEADHRVKERDEREERRGDSDRR